MKFVVGIEPFANVREGMARRTFDRIDALARIRHMRVFWKETHILRCATFFGNRPTVTHSSVIDLAEEEQIQFLPWVSFLPSFLFNLRNGKIC